MSEKKKGKQSKSFGNQIVCPACGDTGPFNPNFGIVTIFTCPQCGAKFDSSGSLGPFTIVCSQCEAEQPFANVRCYMCGRGLSAAKAAELEWKKQIHCSNCHEGNAPGRDRCIRCGQSINEKGDVIHIN